jgi:hypothetical protein
MQQMKYTEQERKEIAKARIKREQQRATTESVVLTIEVLIAIITILFLIIALSH